MNAPFLPIEIDLLGGQSTFFLNLWRSEPPKPLPRDILYSYYVQYLNPV